MANNIDNYNQVKNYPGGNVYQVSNLHWCELLWNNIAPDLAQDNRAYSGKLWLQNRGNCFD